jgi:hypothetical protein
VPTALGNSQRSPRSSYAPSSRGCSGGNPDPRTRRTADGCSVVGTSVGLVPISVDNGSRPPRKCDYVRRDLPSIVFCRPEPPTEIRLGLPFSATGIARVSTPSS